MKTKSKSSVRDGALVRLCGVKKPGSKLRLLLAVGVLSAAVMPGPAIAGQEETAEWLKTVKQATARFHSKTQAVKAGYVPDDHCVSVPGLGGMGYHWLNPLLVDDLYDPLQPEVVLYATGPDGELRLVAIEYIVLDVGQAHPSFGGQPFDIGGTPLPLPHYSLHVWLYEENPNGVFPRSIRTSPAHSVVAFGCAARVQPQAAPRCPTHHQTAGLPLESCVSGGKDASTQVARARAFGTTIVVFRWPAREDLCS
ncbi:MAG: hypothetical protein HS113_25755 [Verrucomicrobiales bacterium]|nr:hypothetical protein [Verrucomicrobiales bacterium]